MQIADVSALLDGYMATAGPWKVAGHIIGSKLHCKICLANSTHTSQLCCPQGHEWEHDMYMEAIELSYRELLRPGGGLDELDP